LLAPVAAKIIADQPEITDWVVTAPPLYIIPSAANLLAWEICRIRSLRSADVHYALPYPQSIQDQYSNTGVAERIKNRQRLHHGEWAPKPDEADFRDRGVLVINDIHVTGTQQEFLQRTLEAVRPARICWLYVIRLAPPLARSNPEIEYQLNHLNLQSFEDFAQIVTRAEIDYTSRCIARLLGSSDAEFELLLRSLDETRRRRLHQLITEEGAYAEEVKKTGLFLA
jgi:hypothetical protein